MKSSRIQKSTNSNSHSSKPFFGKSEEGSFVSETKKPETSFFNPCHIQTKLTVGQQNQQKNPSNRAALIQRQPDTGKNIDLIDEGLEMEKKINSILTFDNLEAAWAKLRRKYPKSTELDCVVASNTLLRDFEKQFDLSLPMARKSVVKEFYDYQKVDGNEAELAIKRYKDNSDKMGDEVTVFKGDGSIKETLKLKPGMLVYTSEACYLNQATKKCGAWDEKHMRMYIGNKQFRDWGNYGENSNNGKPVYKAAKYEKGRKLYIILGVYDPFMLYRDYRKRLKDQKLIEYRNANPVRPE